MRVSVVLCVGLLASVASVASADLASMVSMASGRLEGHLEGVDMLQLLTATADEAQGQCQQDLLLYRESIAKEPWADQMLDSTGKVPEGLQWGNIFSLGVYDECIAVSSPDISFTGQYCLMLLNNSRVLVHPVTHIFGLCVPSSCSGADIEAGLNTVLQPLQLHATVPGDMCSTAEGPALRPGDWVVVAFLIVMAVIALSSTAYDLHQRMGRGKARPHPVLSSFSLYTNMKSILAVSSSGQMGCLHGLRTISMMWVVFFHGYEVALRAMPAINFIEVDKMKSNPALLPFNNGWLTVECFFFLSGFLLCFVFFRDVEKKGHFDTPLAYIHRYIRLTPPYAMMILLEVTLMLYLGAGPLWSEAKELTSRACVTNWWRNLLYIQNYDSTNNEHEMCMRQSWYLAADMQMYWISPLVLYPLHLWPMAGRVWLGVLTIGAVVTNFVVAYTNDLGPSPSLSRNPAHFKIDYWALHMRITPWLVGLSLAYIINSLKARKVQVRLPKAVVALGWFFSTSVCLSIVYSFAVFYDRSYTALEGAAYLSLHRLGWALGIAWIVFACMYGYGGPVNAFLSWSLFQPLAKLSYCTFIIHLTLQTYRIGTMKVNSYIGGVEIVYLFIGDWVLATLLAIPFTLLFELPFGNLDKHYFQNVVIFPYPRRAPQKQGGARSLEAAS